MNEQQLKEAEELLQPYLIKDADTPLHTYSILHNIYKNIILPIKPDICFSTALVVMLCHLSRPLNWFKFNIHLLQEPNKPHIPLNVYGTNILRSGGGKGITTNTMNTLLGFDKIKQQYIDFVTLPDDDKQYVDKLRLVANAEVQDGATTAGLRNINEVLTETLKELHITNSFGSVFFNLEEFADTLDNASAFDRDFLSTLKNLYDLGNAGAKAIREQIKGSFVNFGISFLASTTEKTLQENPQISRAFNNYLIGGNARRTLLSMPSMDEFEQLKQKIKQEPMSLLEWHEKTRYKEGEQLSYLERLIYGKVNMLAQYKRQGRFEILLKEDTYFYYRIYKAYCNHLKDNIHNDILRAEMEGRAWKALKISGILLLYCNNKDDLLLDAETFLEAVKIVEYYGHHLKRYLNSQVVDCAGKIVALLLDAQGHGITQSELAHNNEVLSYNSRNETPVKFFKNQLEDVEQLLNERGYDLLVERAGYRQKMLVYAAIKGDQYQNPKIKKQPPYTVYDNIPQKENS